MIKIEMQDVCLGYARKEVLRGLTFQVLPGEMVGLIGPNGCGKSTIIRALSRVISPYRGRILLDTRDITGISRVELSRLLGVVPQIPLLPSAFTAFEIVLMGRNPHLGLFQYESRRELGIAWRAMEQTMTQHLASRRVGELSGGEIQCLL
ncbi:MAG: ABC transporter ATP-binding protein, partial [Dehalococcoidales bacterium]|nr:ABC transporter ATP-binding protein [Dehalococcoidales bacterium]